MRSAGLQARSLPPSRRSVREASRPRHDAPLSQPAHLMQGAVVPPASAHQVRGRSAQRPGGCWGLARQLAPPRARAAHHPRSHGAYHGAQRGAAPAAVAACGGCTASRTLSCGAVQLSGGQPGSLQGHRQLLLALQARALLTRRQAGRGECTLGQTQVLQARGRWAQGRGAHLSGYLSGCITWEAPLGSVWPSWGWLCRCPALRCEAGSRPVWRARELPGSCAALPLGWPWPAAGCWLHSAAAAAQGWPCLRLDAAGWLQMRAGWRHESCAGQDSPRQTCAGRAGPAQVTESAARAPVASAAAQSGQAWPAGPGAADCPGCRTAFGVGGPCVARLRPGQGRGRALREGRRGRRRIVGR